MLDEVITDAYRWSDIPPDYGVRTHRQMERWTVSPAARVEMLDRPLEENRRRAPEEAAVAVPFQRGHRMQGLSEDEGTLVA